jgi:uncharacterized protein YjbI with pentapeptide repeats
VAIVPALLLVDGAIVAGVAVARASAALLWLAALLLLAGLVVTAVLARRRIPQPGRQVLVIAGTVVLAAVVLVPASMNVNPCTRIGRGADLSGCDLSGDDLAAEDLRDVDLSGADLRGTDLAGAQLTGADLDGANLRGADLADARLLRAIATDADLREADLGGADLSDADLTGADLREAAASEVVLTDADLSDADLTGGDLTGATLDGTDMSRADLTDAVLDTAELPDAVLLDATLAGTQLTGADLARANLSGSDLTGADLTDAQAPDAVFEEAELTEATLRSNDFMGATGLTDEGLAAALGVPAGQLPAETKLRGIVFDPYEAILEAVTPVRDGQAVDESRTYPANDAFHPTIVLDADSSASWLADARDLWAPTGLRFAELVVVVLPESEQSIATCTGYVFDDGRPAPAINRYVRTVTVRVLSAHNARPIAERTFRGSDPRQCQPEEFLSTVAPALYGNPPNLDGEAQPWLADLVNPPAVQPPAQ